MRLLELKLTLLFVAIHVAMHSLSAGAAPTRSLRSNAQENTTIATDWKDFPAYNSTLQELREDSPRRKLLDASLDDRQEPLRILYTVTTLSEFDQGTRATTKGFDRLQKLLVPVVQRGIESMVAKGFHVDLFIISHYTMTRNELVVSEIQSVSPTTQVRFWDSAAPLSYDPNKRDNPKAALWKNTLGLARQHRFVVKDNLFDYDLFLNFEDDMILSGDLVENYLDMTQKLYKLRETAPETVSDAQLKNFHGPLTKDQLKRSYPGLMRVEVLLNEEVYGTQSKLDPVPVEGHVDIDPKPCCHLPDYAAAESRPTAPGSDKMFLWETNIIALGVRHVDELGWVTLLRGPRGRSDEKGMTWSDYWSGTQKYFDKAKRPAPGSFNHVNNEGGWMGTRQQIWEWHTEVCLGGFLPPFDSPHYNFDGLDPRNVEYWSGGLNLFTARHACNMQRLVSLEPDKFSKHLLYHSANNKQRQLHGRKESFVKVNDLYGQLLTVSKDAEEEMKKATK